MRAFAPAAGQALSEPSQPQASSRVARAGPPSALPDQSTAVPKPGAPPRAAGAPEIDVDALVDKVQRKLLRRLAAERERRGGIG
jgi:hypothetical protein